MQRGVFFLSLLVLMTISLTELTAQFMPPITFNKGYPYASPVESYHLTSTSDMGYMISGVADTTDGPAKAMVTKFSCIGVAEWTYRLGYMPVDAETTPFAFETSTSEVVATFTMLDTLDGQREMAITKLNLGNGSPQWMRVISGLDSITSYSASMVKETPDGGYLAVGTRTVSDSTNLRNIVAIKLASDGSVSWQNLYGEALIGQVAEAVTIDDGGNIYITGETQLDPIGPAQSRIQTFVLRLDSLGNMVAGRRYGGFGTQAVTRSRNILFTQNNNLIITGNTTVIDTNNAVVLPADAYTMRVDTAFTNSTVKVYSPDLVNDALDSGNKVIAQDGGGFVIATDFAGAITDSAGVGGGALIFVDEDLDVESARFYNGVGAGTSVTRAMDGGYAVAGYSLQDGDDRAPVLAKTDGNFNSGCEETPVDVSAQDGAWRADTLNWEQQILADTFFFDTVANRISLGSSINCENIPVNMAEFDYTGFCWNQPFEFENFSTGDIQSYSWSFGDGVGFSMDEDPGQYMYEEGGTYNVTLTVSYECVSNTFAQDVFVKKPESSRRDTICQGDFVEINGQQFDQPGIYEIIIPTTECDSVVNLFLTIQECKCDVVVPNAFTPNNDMNNDNFGPIYKCVNSEIVEYTMKIFSRWGEEVFTTNNIDQMWNGNCDGNDCPADIYVYYIQYVENRDGNIQPPVTLKGDIQLIR